MLPILITTFLNLRDLYEKLLLDIVRENIAIQLKFHLVLDEDKDPVATIFTPMGSKFQSYEIKSPPWTILWFRILGIFSVENIKRLCVFMFQT